jgi:hypothetical protein
MITNILILGLIVLVLALIVIIFALIRSQQQNKAQLLLQQTWEYAQEMRQQKWKEEHGHIVAQLEKRLAIQEEQSQQKERAYLKQEEDRKQYYKDQVKDLTQHYEEKIKQLTIDYELALLPHIEDVALLTATRCRFVGKRSLVLLPWTGQPAQRSTHQRQSLYGRPERGQSCKCEPFWSRSFSNKSHQRRSQRSYFNEYEYAGCRPQQCQSDRSEHSASTQSHARTTCNRDSQSVAVLTTQLTLQASVV